jgi:uncharacterized protein YjdB
MATRTLLFGIAVLVWACGGGTDAGGTGVKTATVARVDVTPTSQSIVVGATITLTASARDAQGATISGRTAAWTSSQPSVATVSPAGVVSGVAPGTAVVSASIDGVTGSATIAVLTSPVATVQITGVSITPLVTGQTVQLVVVLKDASGNVLTGRSVTWSTSNAAVASVSSSGLVTGVTTGTATITATSEARVGSVPVTVVGPNGTSVSVTPAPMLVAIGGTATLTVVARDQTGATIPGQAFTFRSSDETIATVTATGVVNGIRAGVVTLTATAQGVSGSTVGTVVAPTVLTGTVLTADGGPPAGLRFSAQTGTGAGVQSFSATISAAGAFSLSAPLGPLPSDSVDLIVDVVTGARTYRPVAARVLPSRAAAVSARPLLIPRVSSFTSTTYGATSATVSLQQAFTRVCTDDTNANCNSFFPQVWKSIVPLWAEGDLPVPLAFNYTATTSAITSADSIALWSVIHQMEADVGRTLFRPATFKDLTPPDANGFSQKAVLVWVDNTLTGFSGYTNWIWDGSQNMLAAKTRVTNVTLLGNRSLMTHELLHALGFHHTCAWPTVMGGYGCSSASGATKADVAAFHLGYAARRTIIASAPTTTFADALRGEQLFDLAASPALEPRFRVPFTTSAFRTMLFGGRSVTGDGAP